MTLTKFTATSTAVALFGALTLVTVGCAKKEEPAPVELVDPAPAPAAPEAPAVVVQDPPGSLNRQDAAPEQPV